MVVNEEIIEQKSALRAEMKARRNLMNESERARASWSLCHRISSFLEGCAERTIGVYLARPYEISLDNLITGLLSGGYEVAAPRVDVSRGEMTFWRLENLEEVEIGPWNVREPLSRHRVDEIPLILVPGLAFDRAGGRLGTGGGWYDRVLTSAQVVVGMGFDCQIVPNVPCEAHDVRMNFIASEGRWLAVD